MSAADIHYITSGFGNVLFLTLLAWVMLTVAIVLAWLALSGIVFTMSHLFRGSGSFRKTLQNTGYGLAPGLMLYGLILLLASLALSAFQTPVIPFGNPASQNQVFLIIGWAGVLVASLWVFVLVSQGLRYARNIPLVKAAVSVGVPVLIFLIFSNLKYLGTS